MVKIIFFLFMKFELINAHILKLNIHANCGRELDLLLLGFIWLKWLKCGLYGFLQGCNESLDLTWGAKELKIKWAPYSKGQNAFPETIKGAKRPFLHQTAVWPNEKAVWNETAISFYIGPIFTRPASLSWLNTQSFDTRAYITIAFCAAAEGFAQFSIF